MRTYIRACRFAATFALLSFASSVVSAQEGTLVVAVSDVFSAAPAQSQQPVDDVASTHATFANDTFAGLDYEELDAVVCDSCSTGCRKCRIGGWYAQADALFLSRENTSGNRPVVINNNNAAVLISTDDLNFDYEPGARILIGTDMCGCCCCCAWEFSYFGVFDWSASQTVTGTNNLVVPPALGAGIVNALTLAEEIRVDYDSEIHSFEANCVTNICESCCRRLDFLKGFRYIRLEEDFDIFGNNAGIGTGFYHVDTTNDLYGLQLGLRDRRTLRGCWGLETFGKAGVYYNDARQRQRVVDVGNFVVRNTSSSDDEFAFLGEIGASLLYQLTDCISLRGGYNLIWLGGVALAPDQLDFTNVAGSGTRIDTNGGVLMHGANVGFEWNF